MFTKYDNKFTDVAMNPELRSAKIANLSRARAIMFCCACVMMVLTVLDRVSSPSTASNVGLLLTAGMQWLLALKFDSDLKLLNIAARLQTFENKKPYSSAP